MLNKLFLLFLCLVSLKTKADTGGNPVMYDCTVSFKNISKFNGYTFYWQNEDDSIIAFSTDNSFTIKASRGAPYNAYVWAVNNQTHNSTDTLSFGNYYSPNYLITIDTITNNKLRYTEKKIENYNTKDINSSGDDWAADGTSKLSKTVIILSAISIIALVLLIWIFIRNRKRGKEI